MLVHAQQPDDGLCELKINGRGVESLILENQRTHEMVTLESPGESVRLPADEYKLYSALLEGEYLLPPYSTFNESSFHLRSGETFELTVGGPLQPTVTAHRTGRSVNLSYQLLDQAGRQYTPHQEGASDTPRFKVYISKPGQPDEEIGRGTFEYG